MSFSGNRIGFSVKFYFGNHVLNIFFEPMEVSVSNSKRKIRKRMENIWEIEKPDYLKRPSELDFHLNVILKEKFYSLTTSIQCFLWIVWNFFQKVMNLGVLFSYFRGISWEVLSLLWGTMRLPFLARTRDSTHLHVFIEHLIE